MELIFLKKIEISIQIFSPFVQIKEMKLSVFLQSMQSKSYDECERYTNTLYTIIVIVIFFIGSECTRGCGHTLLHILYRQAQHARSSQQCILLIFIFCNNMKSTPTYVVVHVVCSSCCWFPRDTIIVRRA